MSVLLSLPTISAPEQSRKGTGTKDASSGSRTRCGQAAPTCPRFCRMSMTGRGYVGIPGVLRRIRWIQVQSDDMRSPNPHRLCQRISDSDISWVDDGPRELAAYTVRAVSPSSKDELNRHSGDSGNWICNRHHPFSGEPVRTGRKPGFRYHDDRYFA